MCAVPVVATPTLPELRVHRYTHHFFPPNLNHGQDTRAFPLDSPYVGPDTLSALGGLGEFSGVSITSICQIKSI